MNTTIQKRPSTPLFATLGLGLLSACASTTYQASQPQNASHVDVMYGQRRFDSDLEPVEDQEAFGVQFSTKRAGELAGWEAGFIHSSDSATEGGSDVELKVNELYAGGRYEFDVGYGPIHPYAGVGLAWLDTKVEVDSDSEKDKAFGIYAHIGAYVNVGGDITFGIDYRRLLKADVDYGDGDLDADYDLLGFTLGFGF